MLTWIFFFFLQSFEKTRNFVSETSFEFGCINKGNFILINLTFFLIREEVTIFVFYVFHLFFHYFLNRCSLSSFIVWSFTINFNNQYAILIFIIVRKVLDQFIHIFIFIWFLHLIAFALHWLWRSIYVLLVCFIYLLVFSLFLCFSFNSVSFGFNF